MEMDVIKEYEWVYNRCDVYLNNHESLQKFIEWSSETDINIDSDAHANPVIYLEWIFITPISLFFMALNR